MNLTDVIQQYFNKLGTIAKELDAIGVEICDEVKMMVLLVSLPKSYQYLIIELRSLKEENHTWDNMNTRLFNEKVMHKEKGESYQTIETTLHAQKILNPKRTRQTRVKTYVTTTNKHATGLEIARKINTM
jgi:hypothetical protein